MNPRRTTIAGIKGTPAEKRNDQKNFRKNLAKARKFESEMGQIRNTVGLQPGTKVKEEYKGPKRLLPGERNQREMKQYSNPPRKPKM